MNIEGVETVRYLRGGTGNGYVSSVDEYFLGRFIEYGGVTVSAFDWITLGFNNIPIPTYKMIFLKQIYSILC